MLANMGFVVIFLKKTRYCIYTLFKGIWQPGLLFIMAVTMVLMVALPWWDWERHNRLWISDFGIATLAALLNAEQEEHEYEGRKELD